VAVIGDMRPSGAKSFGTVGKPRLGVVVLVGATNALGQGWFAPRGEEESITASERSPAARLSLGDARGHHKGAVRRHGEIDRRAIRLADQRVGRELSADHPGFALARPD